LSHASSAFALAVSQIGFWVFALDWNRPTYASCVAEITGMYHHAQCCFHTSKWLWDCSNWVICCFSVWLPFYLTQTDKHHSSFVLSAPMFISIFTVTIIVQDPMHSCLDLTRTSNGHAGLDLTSHLGFEALTWRARKWQEMKEKSKEIWTEVKQDISLKQLNIFT
jgi:hypothetical protein